MTRHPDSPAFIRYLQNTICKFIDPVEEIAWENWEEGDDTPDAHIIISSFLNQLAIQFANLDNISDDKTAFIVDIRTYLNEACA